MFRAHLNEFKIREKELIAQAEQQRLVKSVQEPRQRYLRIQKALGRTLIRSGRVLVSRAQVAH